VAEGFTTLTTVHQGNASGPLAIVLAELEAARAALVHRRAVGIAMQSDPDLDDDEPPLAPIILTSRAQRSTGGGAAWRRW